MPLTAYLAGPDVFLPNAMEQARAKVALCAKYGIVGRAPVDPDKDPGAGASGLSDQLLWGLIYRQNMALMAASDLIIANLTPFRGASADVGTAVEVGYFLGAGKPVYGYTNESLMFAPRSIKAQAAMPDAVAGMTVETFGLPDNLMLAGACRQTTSHGIVTPQPGSTPAWDALEVFERCVMIAALQHGLLPRLEAS